MSQFFVNCTRPVRRRARRALFGLSIVGLGVLALLDNMHVYNIALLRTFWPLVLVVWAFGRLVWPRKSEGLLFSVLVILAGGMMTTHNLGYGALELRQWWPMLLILAGASIALRGLLPARQNPARHGMSTTTLESTDQLDIDTTFSGVELRSESRDFKGGRISVTFGGAEIDLREAVMQDAEATIQLNASFGGIELRVPLDWEVVVQVRATMGAVENKSSSATSNHRLLLQGEIMFSGVEIKN